jgi:hypothetical protein
LLAFSTFLITEHFSRRPIHSYLMIEMRKAVVIKDYQSEYTNSLIVKAGTIIITEEKESEWEGWVWCRTEKGIYRWYPVSYLRKLAGKSNQYKLIRDYNPKELPVQIGEKVTIQFEESSWAWLVKQDGEAGWVPLENLEVID